MKTIGLDDAAVYRSIWRVPVISSSFSISLSMTHAIQQHAEKTEDLIAFGRAFISSPDLVNQIRNNYAVDPFDYETFYTHEALGYTDYSKYSNKD